MVCYNTIELVVLPLDEVNRREVWRFLLRTDLGGFPSSHRTKFVDVECRYFFFGQILVFSFLRGRYHHPAKFFSLNSYSLQAAKWIVAVRVVYSKVFKSYSKETYPKTTPAFFLNFPRKQRTWKFSATFPSQKYLNVFSQGQHFL